MSNPYAIAGEGFIQTDDTPAMAAVAEATLFMNPRRFVVVLLLSISFEVFEETAISYFDAEVGTTKAYDDGARIARAANAAERKEVVLVMVGRETGSRTRQNEVKPYRAQRC